MEKKKWKKYHKIIGIPFAFIIILFSASGIILNHRRLVDNLDIPRSMLPKAYSYSDWNNGLIKGDMAYKDSVIVYGNNGLWIADKKAKSFKDFNKGLPAGTDFKNIRNIALTADSSLFAAGRFDLYRLCHGSWEKINIGLGKHEQITDVIAVKDSLIVLSRSFLYTLVPPYEHATKIQISEPRSDKMNPTLFRILWLLHSGELFGITGKIIVDICGLILIMLSFTGIVYWLIPKIILHQKRSGKNVSFLGKMLKKNYKWHERGGTYFFILTMIIVISGWCLRPPILIAVSQLKCPPPPFTSLDTGNKWDDKLRCIRYDTTKKRWLLSTSEGFFHMNSLTDVPVKYENQPPVSVMGLNVWEKRNDEWIIGSFSGLYTWDETVSKEYISGKVVEKQGFNPFGKTAISGFCDNFDTDEWIVEYVRGTKAAVMPASFKNLNMSLWNLCVEIHTGRIFTFLGILSFFYVTIMGVISIFLLISGYKLRRR